MFVFKHNGKRVNIHAPYKDENGVTHPRVPEHLIEDISEPLPPADYTEESYFITRQDLPPYVTYTKKSDEVLIAAAKAKKLDEINNLRNMQMTQNVNVHGRPWQADAYSQDLITKTITMVQFGVPLPPSWRDANNENMAINSITQLVQIAAAIAANIQYAYNNSWNRKAALEEATTLEEVESV